jgi:cytochrome c oxidase subunit 2
VNRLEARTDGGGAARPAGPANVGGPARPGGPKRLIRGPGSRRIALVAALAGCALLLAGCGGKQNMLNDHSPQAHDIMLLWWWMLGAGAIVLLGALGMLLIGYITRKRPGLPFFGTRESVPQVMVLLFGIAIPAVVLVVLFAVADVYLVGKTSPPSPKTTAMTIHVIGRQWWWEVDYPGTGVVTANEIHIPTRTRINVVVTTGDVIHSFWVPSLNRKIDMIPGRINRVLLYASNPGAYRGQCSQFCGLEHARMAMWVFAQPKAQFEAWLHGQERVAAAPRTNAERLGEAYFLSDQCASCHTIAGTPAQGDVGPNLTHVGSRTTLAALTIPNTPYWMSKWIANPQAIKPGVQMPDLGVPPAQIKDIVAYLESLK